MTEITKKTTRNGDEMAFLTVEDMFGTVEVVVFARDYRANKERLVKDTKLLIKGNASIDERGGKLLFSRMTTFDELRRNQAAAGKELWIRFAGMQLYINQEVQLLGILKRHAGQTVVKIAIQPPKTEEQQPGVKVKQLADSYRVLPDEALLAELKQLYGGENVILVDKKGR